MLQKFILSIFGNNSTQINILNNQKYTETNAYCVTRTKNTAKTKESSRRHIKYEA